MSRVFYRVHFKGDLIRALSVQRGSIEGSWSIWVAYGKTDGLVEDNERAFARGDLSYIHSLVVNSTTREKWHWDVSEIERKVIVIKFNLSAAKDGFKSFQYVNDNGKLKAVP